MSGYTKIFDVLKGNGNGTSKLPTMLIALMTGLGGAAVGTYSKVEVHSEQIKSIQEDLKEIKGNIQLILRKL